MKKFLPKFLMIFGLAFLAGALLLKTSQSVQQAEDKKRALQADIQAERETIKILEAEWAYLNTPARLEMLALEYTDLVPVVDSQSVVRSGLPPSVTADEERQGFSQPISYESAGESVDSNPFPSVFMKPEHKPKPAGKDLDALLNELQSGAGQ